MCGIIGIYAKEHVKQIEAGLKVILPRGQDAQKIINKKNFSIGHCLHSIVERVEQPFQDEEKFFTSNCEIYNWEELNKKHSLNAQNDSEMIFKFLQVKIVSNETLSELDGVYAFAYDDGEKVWLARDIIGIKPLWYSHSDGFYFASEKKALEKIGVVNIQELNPRKILCYNKVKDKLELTERSFFTANNETKSSFEKIKTRTSELIDSAVKKRIPNRKFGVLFSGGIDSTYISYLLKKFGQSFICYTAVLDDPALKKPQDLEYAEMIAKELGFDLKVIKIPLARVEGYIKKIIPLIEDYNVIKVGVALPFYVACEEAKKDGCKVLFSGLGSEEIFAGYARHKESININRECVSGLIKLYERDLYRDDVVTMHNQIELRLPLLDKTLVEYALTIPSKYKLYDGVEKYVLRQITLDNGMPELFANRKKKAAQYGSNFHKALDKLTKKNGFKLKSEYLRQFYPGHNYKLGALLSTGKDSVYALYTMQKQKYNVACTITIDSSNEDSYMFHTPAIELAAMQSEAMGLPHLVWKTNGEKEKELDDLRDAIVYAKEKYQIEGIITGALFSNYQRERVEKICDELSLKIFNPLWHINQETEMREVIREGFEFIMVKIAAEGLNKSWLNKIITQKDIDNLSALNDKVGLNIAGEGGEFESLVLDGPNFTKKIVLEDVFINEEDEMTATLIIKKAKLVEK